MVNHAAYFQGISRQFSSLCSAVYNVHAAGVVITLAEWMINWRCALRGIRLKEPEFLIQNYMLTDIGYHVLWSCGIGSRVWFTRKFVIG